MSKIAWYATPGLLPKVDVTDLIYVGPDGSVTWEPSAIEDRFFRQARELGYVEVFANLEEEK